MFMMSASKYPLFSFEFKDFYGNSIPLLPFFPDFLEEVSNLVETYRKMIGNNSFELDLNTFQDSMQKTEMFYSMHEFYLFHSILKYCKTFNANQEDFFKCYYALGVDLSIRDHEGYGLVDIAIIRGHFTFALWLLEHAGADLDCPNKVHPLFVSFKKYTQGTLSEGQWKTVYHFYKTNLPVYSKIKNTIVHVAAQTMSNELLNWMIQNDDLHGYVQKRNTEGYTSLMIAVSQTPMSRDWESATKTTRNMLNLLIHLGENINDSFPDDMHTFHYFAKWGFDDLIEEGQSCIAIDLMNILDGDEQNILYCAVQSSNMSLVEKLLSLGFEFNDVQGSNFSPSLYAFKSSNLIMLKNLYEKGYLKFWIDNEKLVDENGRDALHYAVYSDNVEVVRWLIETHGFDVNFQDKYGHTALLVLCDQPPELINHELVEYLIYAKANTRIYFSDEHLKILNPMTKLKKNYALLSHFLLIKKHDNLFFELLEKGLIRLDDVDEQQQTLFDMLCILPCSKLAFLRLVDFLEHHPEIDFNPQSNIGYGLYLDYLLQSKRLTPTSFDNHGDAAIHLFIRHVYGKVFSEDLKHLSKLDINFKNTHRQTPLSLVLEKKDNVIIKQFLETHAKKLKLLDINEKGQNILEVLFVSKSYELIDCILKNEIQGLDIKSLIQEILVRAPKELLERCLKVTKLENFYDNQKSPLLIIFERNDDTLLKEVIKRFPSLRVAMKQMDKGGQHILCYILDYKRYDFLKWWINQSYMASFKYLNQQQWNVVKEKCADFEWFQPLYNSNHQNLLFNASELTALKPRLTALSFKLSEEDELKKLTLSKEIIFNELVRSDMDSAWFSYLLKNYQKDIYPFELCMNLLEVQRIDVVIKLMQLKWVPLQITDIEDKSLLIKCLERQDTTSFRVLLNFYLTHGNQVKAILENAFFWMKSNPTLLVELLKETGHKLLLEWCVTHLNLCLKEKDIDGLSISDYIFRAANRESMDWIIKKSKISLLDLNLELYFNKSRSYEQIISFINIWQAVYQGKALKDFQAQLSRIILIQRPELFSRLKDAYNLQYIFDINDKDSVQLFSILLECADASFLSNAIRKQHIPLSASGYVKYFKQNDFDKLTAYLDLWRDAYQNQKTSEHFKRFQDEMARAAIAYLPQSEALMLLNELQDINSYNEKQQSLLHAVVMNNRPDLFFEVMIRMNSQMLNVQDLFQYTVLHYAILFGNEFLIQSLIELPGIDFRLTDSNRQNICHLAVRFGMFNVLEKVLEKDPELFYYYNLYGHSTIQYLENDDYAIELDMDDVENVKIKVKTFFEQHPEYIPSEEQRYDYYRP